MKNFNLQKYSILLLLFALLSCANEDPNLVNPKLPNQTIRIRFFNLANDKLERKLVLSTDSKTLSTPVGSLSLPVMPPPLDSIYISTEINGSQEYQTPNRLRMIRDTKYIILGLPKPAGQKPLDTLLVTTTTYTPLRDKNNCFISMINVDPDTNSTYSLVLGCPNGPLIFPILKYLQSSIDFETISANIPVSIVKINGNIRSSIGLYTLKLFKGGEFLVVVRGDTNNRVQLLNKQDPTNLALETLKPEPNLNSLIRTINFSKSVISISKAPSDNINSNQASGYISAYIPVKACDSETLDSLVISSGGSYLNSLKTSLVVNSNYTMLVLDSANSPAKLCMIVPPQTLTFPLGDSAMIRVVNACTGLGDLTLSMGARDSKSINPVDSLNSGFVSGEFFANQIGYGKISNAVFLPSGRAPMTLFTASQPTRLLHTAIGNLKPGNKYIIVITNVDNNFQITMIEDGDVNQNISYLEKGSFLQIANLTPGVLKTEISIPGVLTKAKLYFTSTISTIVPLSVNKIIAGNTSLDYNATAENRDIVVLAGTAMITEILHYQSAPPSYDYLAYSRRIFNAAKDAPSIDVTNSARKLFPDLPPLSVNIGYGNVSDYSSSYIERKNAYFFYTSASTDLLLQISDIAMLFGKSYTLIFGGDKTVTVKDPLTYRYSIILLQDY